MIRTVDISTWYRPYNTYKCGCTFGGTCQHFCPGDWAAVQLSCLFTQMQCGGQPLQIQDKADCHKEKGDMTSFNGTNI